jgi:hypothetical protein
MAGIPVSLDNRHREANELHAERLERRVASLEAALERLVGRQWVGWEWTPRYHTTPVWRCSFCKAEAPVVADPLPVHDIACPIVAARALLAGPGGAR